MIILKKIFRKLALVSFLIAFTFFNALPVYAVGPTEPVGPQGPTGVQGEIGPQVPTGPVTEVEQVTVAPTDSSTQMTPEVGLSETPPDATLLSQENATGTDSLNTANTTDGSASNIDINNNATINNESNADLNTGNNSVGQNTVVGNINTGDINGAETIVNISNTNLAPGSSIGSQTINADGVNEIDLMPSAQRVLFANTETGPNSLNQNEFDNDNVVRVVDANNAIDNNEINIDANTGTNTISDNTKAGNLNTGDINLGVNLINLANLQMPNLLLSANVWNILGDLNGDIIVPELSNSLTGPNSLNENLISTDDSFSAQVTQNADLDNMFNYNTNTGNNTVGQNTIAGGLETGDTNINSKTYNLANIAAIPMFYIFNVYGTWDGQIAGLDPSMYYINLINDTTGPNSANINSISADNATDFNLINNANVSNKINIDANTGNNTVANNTMVGDIETGSINISANIVNILNSVSEKVGKFALNIVNIFGNWRGDAKTADLKTSDNSVKIADKNVKKVSVDSNTNTESTIDYSVQNEDAANYKTSSGSIKTSITENTSDSIEPTVSAAVESDNNNQPRESTNTEGSAITPFLIGAGILIIITGWILSEILSAKILKTRPISK